MYRSAERWSVLLERPPAIHYASRATFRTARKSWRLSFWCVHLYRYTAELRLDGKQFPIRPGYVGIIPPGVFKEYHFHGRSEQLAAHFSLPAAPGGVESHLPAMQDLGRDFEEVWSDFQQAVGYLPTQPRRAEARLWDLLWRLTDYGKPEKGHLTTPVEHARRSIEENLGKRISVENLAEEAGISHNHLTRIFRESLGNTVVGYIRDRRVQRAQHLLLHSTLPIKAIATEVGLSDLHLFNKTIRRMLGNSPRAIRAGAASDLPPEIKGTYTQLG